MRKKVLLLGIGLFLLTFISCSKDDGGNSSALTAEEANVNAKIDEINDDVSKIIDDQYSFQENTGGKLEASENYLPECARITVVVTGNTWTRTIDFGTTGCSLRNGNILKGKIIISGNTNYTESSHTITYNFDAFYHNDKHIEGNKTVVLTIKSTEANHTMHPVANSEIDMKITYPNGNIYKRKGTRVREMVEGFDTRLNWLDNVYVITGNWTTTLPNGAVQTSVITKPLRFRMNCNFIVYGEITITRNQITAILNYGDGLCDNKATVTINGVTHTIELGR